MFRILFALTALASTCVIPLASAQEVTPAFSGSTVRLVVPVSMGGPRGVYALALAEALPKYLGKSVIPQSIPGAGGASAAHALMQVAPAERGGVVLMVGPGTMLDEHLYRLRSELDLKKTPVIGAFTENQIGLAVRKGEVPLPQKMRKGGQVLTPANAIFGTKHLKTEALFRLLEVPYKMLPTGRISLTEQLSMLAKGELSFMFLESGEFLRNIRDNKTPLGVEIEALFQDGVYAGEILVKEKGIDAPLFRRELRCKKTALCTVLSLIDELAITPLVMHPDTDPKAAAWMQQAFAELHSDAEFRNRMEKMAAVGRNFIPAPGAGTLVHGVARKAEDPKVQALFREVFPEAFAPR